MRYRSIVCDNIANEQCLRRRCGMSIGCDEGSFSFPEECALAPLGLCSQRSATKSPKPNFNEVKGESRKEKQRSLVATLCRDDKHTIIFALYSLPCYLYSVICSLLASPKLLSLGIVKVNFFSALAYSQLSLYSVISSACPIGY